MNPLYKQLNVNPMMEGFNRFKDSLNCDPKQKVMELLQSGQMSQQQFDQLQKQAQQFMSLLGR